MFKKIKNLTINFGPQHPAAHGVLRLVIKLSGEKIKNISIHLGLLHRGTEKLIESKTYNQALPYMDRLDYVSTMVQEHCFCLAVESALNLRVPAKAILVRMIFSEITRILNHLLALTTHALDVGALTPFLWGFDLREQLMEFYERVCGARLHAAYIIPGGIESDISDSLLLDIKKFCSSFYGRLDELQELLFYNRIVKQRLKMVGISTLENSKDWAFSGPMLRASGAIWDLRVLDDYEAYRNYSIINIPFGVFGDSLDRFKIRFEEMRQSNYLIQSFISDLLLFKNYYNSYYNKIMVVNNKIGKIKRSFLKRDMESLILHFLSSTLGFVIPLNESYRVVEAPKGEFAIGLTSDGTSRPSRCSIRAPGFLHVQGITSISQNLFLSDLVTVLGTLDLVFGEIDR